KAPPRKADYGKLLSQRLRLRFFKMPNSPPAQADPLPSFKQAFMDDDAVAFAELLNRFPEMKARINDPVGPFDSPLVTCVKSCDMLDVLLAAGADINARSRWWAGGFGLLDS